MADDQTAVDALTGGKQAFSDIPVSQQLQMAELLTQFQKESGFQIDVPLSMIHSIAQQGVSDLRIFSMYVWDHSALTDQQRESMPWVGVGMTHDQYDTRIREYAAEYKRMTGSDLNPFGHLGIKNGFITDPTYQKAWDAMRTDTTPAEFAQQLQEDKDAVAKNPGLPFGLDYQQSQAKMLNLNGIYKQLTGQNASSELLAKSIRLDSLDFRTNLIQDPKLLDTYGWLKYGKDYQQFQQYKTDERSRYGTDLTDQQAIATLAENHAAGHILGAYQTAVLAPQQNATRQQDIPGVQSSDVR